MPASNFFPSHHHIDQTNIVSKKSQKFFLHLKKMKFKQEKFHHTTSHDYIGKMATCLCVGPKNSGKTMLLTSIQYPGTVNFTTHSVNTVGTALYTIPNDEVSDEKKKKCGRKSVNVRELGGEMAVMWKKYYNEKIDKIIFVVDTSNLCQISCGGEF